MHAQNRIFRYIRIFINHTGCSKLSLFIFVKCFQIFAWKALEKWKAYYYYYCYYCCCCCFYCYYSFANMDFLEVTAAKQTTIYSRFILTKHDLPSTVTSDNRPQCNGYHWKQFALKYRFTFITTNPLYFQTCKASGKMSEELSSACKIKDWGSETDPHLAPV